MSVTAEKSVGGLRISPIEAYRLSYAAQRQEPPTEFLRESIEVGTLLQAAASDVDPATRAALLDVCRTRSIDILGPERAHAPWPDPSRPLSATAPIRELVFRVLRKDQLPLGVQMAESLATAVASDPKELARALQLLSACDRMRGMDDMSLARAHRVFEIARATRSDELAFRAWTMIANRAAARGNLPRSERAARRAMKYAERLGDGRALAIAHCDMAVVHGMRGDLREAVVHHWQSFAVCDDNGALLERLLANAAETLYRSGRFRASRAARGEALRLSDGDASPILVSLGGYAVSAAALGDRAGVEWAAAQALAVLERHPYESRAVAQGILGCADGCAEAGLTGLASRFFAHGIRIAEEKGYHDLRFRTDPTTRPFDRGPRTDFSAEAEQAATSFENLAPDGIPASVVLVG